MALIWFEYEESVLMHELVKIAMRGPIQAVMLACITMLIPLMFWFSAAVVSLITLRKGFQQGAVVFFWTTLPAMVWLWSVQDPGPLIVLCMAFLMACILRMTISWQTALVSGALVSFILGWTAPYLMPEVIQTLSELADQFFRELAKQSEQDYTDELKQGFESLMIAGFVSSFYGVAIGSLCLARSWQAKLFNPGGWQEEFYQIRIQPRVLMAALLVLMLTPALGWNTSVVLLTVAVALTFGGIALVHGLIARKNMTKQWLVGFYLSIVLLFPTILILVVIAALMDSLIDFRSRVASP
jgi:hypothetical protein